MYVIIFISLIFDGQSFSQRKYYFSSGKTQVPFTLAVGMRNFCKSVFPNIWACDQKKLSKTKKQKKVRRGVNMEINNAGT